MIAALHLILCRFIKINNNKIVAHLFVKIYLFEKSPLKTAKIIKFSFFRALKKVLTGWEERKETRRKLKMIINRIGQIVEINVAYFRAKTLATFP